METRNYQYHFQYIESIGAIEKKRIKLLEFKNEMNEVLIQSIYIECIE